MYILWILAGLLLGTPVAAQTVPAPMPPPAARGAALPIQGTLTLTSDLAARVPPGSVLQFTSPRI